MAGRKVLVVGASGVVGYAAMKRFVAEGDSVIAVSRRAPIDVEGAQFISLDLQDRAVCAAAVGGLKDVTHLVYAALFEKPGLIGGWFEDDQIETNDKMFRNVLDPLLDAAPLLRHVTLLQGTKAYGMRTPTPIAAREDRDETYAEPNFYWRHEGYLKERRAGAAWGYTILRPQVIFGLSIGSAMNLIPALGAYGAILKARGEPLHYPGARTSFVLEAVDADLLASVILWAASAPGARDQAFNVTNGDVFAWPAIWPGIANALGMAVGEDRPTRMGESAAGWAGEWDAIRAQHGLSAPALAPFVGESFHYADMLLNFGSGAGRDGAPPTPSLLSTLKLRRAGFHEVAGTEEMFRKLFAQMQDLKLLPPR